MATGIGVNYVTKFEGAKIGAAFGYGTNKESTVNRSDPEVYGVAFTVSSGPFKVNASYVDRDDQTNDNGVTTVAGQETFEVGLKYSAEAMPSALDTKLPKPQTSAGTAFDGDEHTAMVVSYSARLCRAFHS